MTIKNQKVWSTTFKNEPRNVKSIDFHIDRNVIEYLDEFRDHKPVDAGLEPKYIYFKLRDWSEKKKSNLPDLMMISGGIFLITEAFGKFLRDFDLGACQIFEVPLYEFDQKTQRLGRWFIFHPMAAKDTLIEDQCENVEDRYGKGKYYPLSATQDKDVKLVLSAEARRGADFWFEERFNKRIFVSDKFKTALKASDLRVTSIPFHACKIIETPS